MRKLTPKPSSRVLRKVAGPVLAGVVLTSATACETTVVGLPAEPEPAPADAGGEPEPEAVGEPPVGVVAEPDAATDEPGDGGSADG